ncbi:hypothetical protein EHS25_001248 [Saitozyma podzolica]|uniref:BRCT domain-containing protein n=1 Tax=Saitozyma podzolica TaxID=1890683 RepID=A0A427YHT3_9TREE|nr:hypothetical protein EHS25_001248 [Saitozyma podzolica]
MPTGPVAEEVKPAPSTTGNSKAESVTSTSMPPPSRIPVIRSSRPSMQPLRPTGPKDEGEFKKPAFPPPEKSEPARAKTTSAPSSLPERRPSSRPTMRSSRPSSASVDLVNTPAGPAANSASSSGTAAPEAGKSVRRKPSYPSSLGHGPPMRQTPRMVSVPVPSHVIDRSSTMDIDDGLDPNLGPAVRPSPRSVSDPAPRSRLSLSMSTRREGWMDTSKSLVGLSEALERLKVKKEVEPTRRPSSGSTSTSARQSLSLTTAVPLQEHRPNPNLAASTSTSSRLSAVHKPRQSSSITITITGATTGDESVIIDDAANDKSLAALMSSTSGGTCLKGVVAFVDVFTADGTDSSAVFVDMLRSLGARVLSRPTDSVTHIIFKSGRPNTLAWYRKQSDPPHMVGISWVTKSKEAGKRVEEDKYKVDIGEVEEVFAKRRKSMEPRALGLGTAPMGGNGRPSFLSANVLEARRKSMQHLPKISSPLKKGYGAQHDDSE